MQKQIPLSFSQSRKKLNMLFLQMGPYIKSRIWRKKEDEDDDYAGLQNKT
jgi:hypothetical protein